jgi:hypothetical protein
MANKKNGIFKIWLVGLANPKNFAYGSWGEGTMYVIGMKLKSMFDRVCQHPASPFTGSDYFWDLGVVQDTDVVV